MQSYLKRQVDKFRTAWYGISNLPDNYFRQHRDRGLTDAEDALSLPPIFAALRWYQTTLSKLPLITYLGSDKGREQAITHAAYNILNYKPNNGMTRNTFWQLNAKRCFSWGESFNMIRWNNGNRKTLK